MDPTVQEIIPYCLSYNLLMFISLYVSSIKLNSLVAESKNLWIMGEAIISQSNIPSEFYVTSTRKMSLG